jgi:hypothetical protein
MSLPSFERHTGQGGSHETAITSLFFSHVDSEGIYLSERVRCLNKASPFPCSTNGQLNNSH